MTGFDNGPKDGDFVRYIDALNAARAAASVPSNPSQPTPGPSPFAAQSTNRQPMVPSTAGATRIPTSQAPRAPSMQARAIAESLLRADGTVGPRQWGSIAVLAIGLVLMIAGLVAATFNAAFFAAGAALVYWTVGRWIRQTRGGADSPFGNFLSRRR